MTVKYALIQNQGKIIKIGASNGFMYCGKCDENVLEELERIEKETYEEMAKSLKNTRRKLHLFESTWELRKKHIIDKWFFKKYKKCKVELKDNYFFCNSLEELEKEIQADKERSFDTLTSYNEKIGTYLDNYKPFLERDVLEIYPSIDTYENVDLIIVFDGIETGRYWTCEEYERGVNEK